VTGIAESTVHGIISDLNFCKLSACWILKIFTEEHKSKRMAASLKNRSCYQDERESFIESIERKKKLHDLQTSSFTHKKKNSKCIHLL
jgi:hypothetical protein